MAGGDDMHKLKIQRQNVCNNRQDMISNLPDNILHYIISLLETRDAVRTSVLAKRWEYLWTNLSTFDFYCHRYKYSPQTEKSANCLLDRVEKLLLDKSTYVKTLTISIRRITIEAHKVDSLISYAVHKVQNLNLTLEKIDLNARYVLPHIFSSSQTLNSLHLDVRATLYIPSGICFPNLKNLELFFLIFANEMSIQLLFFGCPILQELTLHNCKWDNISEISVAISTLRVFTFFFDGDQCLDDNNFFNCNVKIDAPNLLSLSYTSSPTIRLFLVNPISIVDACIDLMCFHHEEYLARCAIEILKSLNGVEFLTLTDVTLPCLSYAKDDLHRLPPFHNMTKLCVGCSLLYAGIIETVSEVLMDILPKTPHLKVLDIPAGFEYFRSGKEWTWNSMPSCFKTSLKFLNISIFHGNDDEVQLVKLLLENATALEEIEIVCWEDLLSKSEKLAQVRNQLYPVGHKKCVIKFLDYRNDRLVM